MIAANDNGAPANAGVLTFASVCSGIEAASVAFNPLGWRAVCFSEIEKFPSAVLAHHYPDVPNLGDFTKIDTRELPRVDILCGGTPCQAFSVAGLRQSLDDARGNLSLEFVRLAHELAGSGKTGGNGLRNVVWENVPGVLSTKDNAFGCFLAGLVGADAPLVPPDAVWGECTHFDAESYDVHRTYGWQSCTWANEGMVEGPRARAAWRILDAQYFGLAQRRRRVIVVADFGNGADPAAVLFERAGLQGDSPPSRETGEGVAVSPSLRARANCSHRADSQAYVPEIARCVATREGSSQDYESTTMVAVGVTGQISHALKAEGADASEDGTGRGTPIVATSFAWQSSFGDMGSEEISGTLVKNQIMGVLTHAAEITPTLGKESYSPMKAPSGQAVDFAITTNSAVRRLTPKECERLQGFKDDYTNIPWRGKDESPDGPRYKALGNSWAVPKFTWLGKRIAQHMPPIAANDNEALRNVA